MTYEKCFPLITKTIRNTHFSKPYITSEIKNLIKERNKLQRKSLKWPITYGKQYRKLRNKINQMIQKEKSRYFKTKLEESKSDVRKSWSVINEVLNRKTRDDSYPASALLTPDQFNEHFINVGPSLSAKITPPKTSFSSYLPTCTRDTFSFRQCTITEIQNIIISLNDSAPGYDELPGKIIKSTSNTLSPIITSLCNRSLALGVFPDPLNIAVVRPIYKSGDDTDLNNYRPISVLNFLSKIFEKVAYTQLMEHLKQNNILSTCQYGFRPLRSTETALQNFVDVVLTAFDENKFTISVFLDLSKAFDTVDHTILLNKLEHYGVRYTTLKWFKSYITSRMQSVKLNKGFSSQCKTLCGIPQGSILGPLLIILYINDIVYSTQKLNFILYADDSTLFTSHHNLTTLINTLNSELAQVSCWLAANKLTLNIKKTKYMILHRNKRIMNPLPPIYIKDCILEEVTKFKFLGVIISKSLNWHEHIMHLKCKLSKVCGVLHLSKSFLTKSSMLLIYFALIYSNLTYCNTIWGAASKEALRPLEVVQKRAIRIIDGLCKREHTNASFYKYNLLKLHDINIFSCSNFIFKCLNGLAINIFFLNQINRRYPTRNNNTLIVPFVSSSQSQTNVKFYGPKFYNELPCDVRSKTTLYSFKNSLKQFLVHKYSAIV